ncbi:MAG: hypothetical protein P4N60_04600 [Verrucomicrobiae bacterium]|nr:hypothetical protein [Verrucomicrobiae bacterium]
MAAEKIIPDYQKVLAVLRGSHQTTKKAGCVPLRPANGLVGQFAGQFKFWSLAAFQ